MEGAVGRSLRALGWLRKILQVQKVLTQRVSVEWEPRLQCWTGRKTWKSEDLQLFIYFSLQTLAFVWFQKGQPSICLLLLVSRRARNPFTVLDCEKDRSNIRDLQLSIYWPQLVGDWACLHEDAPIPLQRSTGKSGRRPRSASLPEDPQHYPGICTFSGVPGTPNQDLQRSPGICCAWKSLCQGGGCGAGSWLTAWTFAASQLRNRAS